MGSSAIRRGRPRGARGDVVGHGDAGVDEGERAGVQAGGEQGAVLRDDVERDVDCGAGVEFCEEGGGEGGGDGGLHFEEAAGLRGPKGGF